MSVTTITTRVTHRYLMGKSKYDLARWILDDLERKTELNKSIVKFARHTDDCESRHGSDCSCGKERAVADAREWIDS